MSSYIIGSFNMYKFNNRKDDTINKELSRIATIIKSEKFDVVAMQEVLNENAVKELAGKLGSNWAYCWESPKEYSRSSAEGYAYIWNKRRLDLVQANSNPKIANQYRVKGNRQLASGGLIRPPYIARFTPKGKLGGSNFEIRLINTHIIFNSPSGLTEKISSNALRDEEFRVLTKEIYPRVADKRYGNNMPAYTILLGDYNLCISSPGHKVPEVSDITSKRRILTVQNLPTSLKKPQNQSADSSDDEEEENTVETSLGQYDFYSKDYDHFSYDEELKQKLYLANSRVDAITKYPSTKAPNDDALTVFRREVSDHVPIKLEINLKKR